MEKSDNISATAADTTSISSPLCVLIADDHKDARRNTRLMLALVPGVKVVAMARNGREAIELAVEHKPHLAIMDINMP